MNLRGRSENGKSDTKPPNQISDRRPHMAGSPPPDVQRQRGEDEVVQKDAEVGDAQLENLGRDVPAPARPYPMSVVTNFVKALNDATAFLSDGKIPPIRVDLPQRVAAWNQPLPKPVYAMAKIIVQAVQMADPEGKFKSMVYDPATVATPEGLRDVTGKLIMMARDENLKAVMSRPQGEMAGEPPPAAPGAPEAAPPVAGGGAPVADEAAQPMV